VNISGILADLKAHLERLNRVIAYLEAVYAAADPGIVVSPCAKRRVQKRMSAEERKQVSLRMKRYWADRRQ